MSIVQEHKAQYKGSKLNVVRVCGQQLMCVKEVVANNCAERELWHCELIDALMTTPQHLRLRLLIAVARLMCVISSNETPLTFKCQV